MQAHSRSYLTVPFITLGNVLQPNEKQTNQPTNKQFIRNNSNLSLPGEEVHIGPCLCLVPIPLVDHPVHCQACSLAGSFPQFLSLSLAACAPSRPALRPSRGTHVLSLPFLSWPFLRLLRVLWQRKEENDIPSSPLTLQTQKNNLEIGHYLLPEAKRCWRGGRGGGGRQSILIVSH